MFPQVNVEERTISGPTIDITTSTVDIFRNVTSPDIFGKIAHTLSMWWNIYSLFAFFISFLFFLGFLYAKTKHNELEEQISNEIEAGEKRWRERHSKKTEEFTKWQGVTKLLEENNPNSWKMAVIEADIILKELLDSRGYVGSTIADQLKSASASSFSTLQDAWDAHKTRNQIAHEGGDFVLTKKLANETVMRFERFFRELGAL